MVYAIKRRFPTQEKVIESKVGISRKQLNDSLEKHGRKLKIVDGEIVVIDGD